MSREVKLPLGTTLEEWKAEVRRLYPTASFGRDHLGRYHAQVGIIRKGTWFGHYDGGPSPETQAWIIGAAS